MFDRVLNAPLVSEEQLAFLTTLMHEEHLPVSTLKHKIKPLNFCNFMKNIKLAFKIRASENQKKKLQKIEGIWNSNSKCPCINT